MISRQIANAKRIIRLISLIFMWILLIDFFIKLSDVIYDHLKKFFMVYISICLLNNDHVKDKTLKLIILIEQGILIMRFIFRNGTFWKSFKFVIYLVAVFVSMNL